VTTTIDQGFTTLSSRLNLSGLQEQTVSTRQQNVRAAVACELDVVDSFLTGSYRRSTLITPLKEADVDVFVVLQSKYFERGARNVLDSTKRVLLQKYTTPQISRNGQAVTITFSDFKLDVVPSFNRKGGRFLIPNSGDDSWISTDPKAHVALSSEQNMKHEGSLVPLIKMIKGWNRMVDRHFRFFHLEVLAWSIFEGVTISSYPAGVRYFFDKAQAKIPVKVVDPAGYGGDVGAYIYTANQISDAVSRLETARSRALKAEQLAAAGKIPEAYAEWRKVFGDYFPAYG
jgi:hypothetical protein